MDMNKTFFIRKEDCRADWHVIDASDKILGRLATEATDLLRGKGKPEFSNHANCGDYVVVINCEKIKMTGDKWKQKEYKSYSGWRSGLDIIRLAVKRMLPKNRLSREVLKRLKIYVGSEHPHAAQIK
jgi:large subunit ribosomal protein L13